MMTIVFISLLSPATRIFPAISVQTALSLNSRAGWVSGIIAIPLTLIFARFMVSMMKNRGDNEGLADIIIRAVGKPVGKIAITLIALWLTFYSGFILRSAAERLLASVFENGSITVFIIVTLATSLIVAMGEVRHLGRTSEVIVPILGVVFITVLVFGATDVKLENLLPVSYHDIPGALLGTLPVINITGITAYALFFSGFVEKTPDRTKVTMRWMLIITVCIALFGIVIVGALSPWLVTKVQYPFFMMIRDVSLLGLFERIEAVVVAVWVFTDFIFLAGLMSIVSVAMKSVVEKGKRKNYVPFVAGGALAVSYLIAHNSFELSKISEIYIPSIQLLIVVIMIPTILIIGRIRKKI